MAGSRRPMSQMSKIETKEALFRARKRILRHLVHAYLRQEGYVRSADTFADEGNITGEFQVCDNIDLDIILQDYCSYYLMRFNKQPLFCRKVEQPSGQARVRTKKTRTESEALPPPPPPAQILTEGLPSTFTVTRLAKELETVENLKGPLTPLDEKPLSGFVATLSADKKPIAEMLYSDIVRPSGVTWSDVKGLEAAKNLLMEAVVYPVRHPELFTGLLSPWRGLLLHGPPGAGKTLLACAAAGEARCTCLNVACSTVVDKWRGQSEKIVQVLFEMAYYYSPSIIFIDEVESLASQRSSAGEHEASRRLKSQLLTELDGIGKRDGIVFLLANSNMPWEIDSAMLRRLEKRIFIPLPDTKARMEMFQMYLESKKFVLDSKIDFAELAARTEGYSGSDIKLVCKEALMVNVRKMLPQISQKGQNHRKDVLQLNDVLAAIEKTKPISKNLTQRHEQWQNDMGCS